MSSSRSPSSAPSQNSTLADLTANCRRTSGRRPPPLVGCSMTLIDDHVYVFGGRLVPTRTMVNTLYSLSLRSLEWKLLWPLTGDRSSSASFPTSPTTPTSLSSATSVHPPLANSSPAPRYFHSAEAWGKKLVIAFGEGYSPSPAPSDSLAVAGTSDPLDELGELCTLGDVCIWDTEKNEWDSSETKCQDGVERPEARYAHLACVTNVSKTQDGKDKSVMVIMGGQDIRNTYLHSMNVLDLNSLTWIRSSTWDRHIGTYRAVLTSAALDVHPSSFWPPRTSTSAQNSPNEQASFRRNLEEQKNEFRKSLVENGDEAALGLKKGENLVQLSSSEKSTEDKTPQPLLLFSNFNFTQVRRDLDLLNAPTDAEDSLRSTSLSNLMSGTALPPGLRFPAGRIVGRHLLIFGTFLSHSVNNFSIWALDLGEGGAAALSTRAALGERLPWMRIDPGSVLSKGSWNRAVVWGNSVVVIGDRERDIATDYDHRQTNFLHLAHVDLEAFGVYQPPMRALPPLAQSMGLAMLAQPYLSDFELRCSDGVRLGCSRKMLVDRWPWFKNKMDDFKTRAKGMLAAQQRRLDAVAQNNNSIAGEDDQLVEDDSASAIFGSRSAAHSSIMHRTAASTTELRLTPRTLDIPEPSNVVQAFLQYLYTLSICTPLQLDPATLGALLVFARTYQDTNLRALATHALHEVLNRDDKGTGTGAAALVYDAATLGGCMALQIRALRSLMFGARANKSRNASITNAASVSPGVNISSPLTNPSSPNVEQSTNSSPAVAV